LDKSKAISIEVSLWSLEI